MQHYAALGRDSAGAYSVNLAPSEVPQDVYSAVVALVEEQRAVDEAAGVEVSSQSSFYTDECSVSVDFLFSFVVL